MALVAATDHRWVRLWAPVVYLGAIVGLALVLSPLGAVVNGSRSWIMIGGLSIQPAEFAKLGVVVGDRAAAGREDRGPQGVGHAARQRRRRGARRSPPCPPR